MSQQSVKNSTGCKKRNERVLVFGVDGVEGHLVGLNGAEVSQVALTGRVTCDVWRVRCEV